MKFRIILTVLSLGWIIAACNISGGGSEEDPPPEEPETEIFINGVKWEEYYPNDSKDDVQSYSILNYTLYCDSLRLGGGAYINYESYYREGLGFGFVVPTNFDFTELDSLIVDFHSPSHWQEKITFNEIDYDKILGEWNRYDTLAPALAKITTFDFEENWMEAEFDVTLILDEDAMQINNARRRADTLHIFGRITADLEDSRSESGCE